MPRLPPLPAAERLVRALPNRLALLIALISFGCIGTFWAFALFVVENIDRQAFERQAAFAAQGLQENRDAVIKGQEGSTVWSDAVRAVRQGDMPWLEENFGPWMYSYLGFDGSFILDADDRPVFAMFGGLTRPASTYGLYADVISPIVDGLRSRMTRASEGLDDSTGAVADLGFTDYRLVGGVPTIISAKPIIPSGDDLQQRPGTEFIHIALKRVDAATANRIGVQYGLEKAAVVPSTRNERPTAVPISRENGDPIGFLVWKPYQPGTALLQRLGPPLLLVLVLGGLTVIVLLQHSRRSAKELARLAFKDQATGLPNRTAFGMILEDLSKKASHGEGEFALFLVDIDRFKNVNDTLGHPAGDELVRQTAERLNEVAVSHSCELARLGGDEFGLLCPAQTDDPAQIAELLVAAMRSPFVIDGQQVFSSVSVGVRDSRGKDKSASAMLREADIALYEAKARGRSQYRLFTDELQSAIAQRSAIEAELRASLASAASGLEVVYQPIVDGSRQLVGAEALLRWKNSSGSHVPPSIFIPVAEERGLISELGNFVLDQVCALLVRSDFPWIAVNVSPIQLRAPDFAEAIEKRLAGFGLLPERLQLEITETTLIDDDENSRRAIRALVNFGVVLALDDFGTGYSSLTYLKKYGISKIKIDRSFVESLGANDENDAIVSAMVLLARSLNKTVTAEGVETEQQFSRLVAIGCDQIQGYFISSPQPAEAALRFSTQTVDDMGGAAQPDNIPLVEGKAAALTSDAPVDGSRSLAGGARYR